MYWSDVDDDNDFDVKETRQKKNAKEVIDENDLYKKYEILNNFVQKQLKNL